MNEKKIENKNIYKNYQNDIINTTIQKKGLKRNTIDKFYTNPNIAKICIKLIKKFLNINENDLIIEPSAGNGSFIKFIKQLSNNYKFYDIEPDNKEIIKQDYLKLDFDKFKNKYKKIHVIGNPPFGRQSSLAIKFIKKSCNFCNSISFILPKSFKKESMQKYFQKNFHLIHQEDLPEKSFLVNDVKYDVPCIFQIWKKKSKFRKIPKKLIPINFSFVKKTDDPDISFRRVGINAGNVSKKIKDKSEQSHYFIKFSNKKNINIDELNKIVFDFNNTIGSKSIGKQELIEKFNIIFS